MLEVRAGIAQYVRAENQQVNERTIDWLHSSAAENRAIRVGDPAPTFTLSDQNGKAVSSLELLNKGPLIVVFFRGRWCPFCVATLEAWRDALAQLQAAGAQFVAISPQLIRHNAFTADQHKLSFPVLSDEGNQVAKQFGIAYRVPAEQEQLYRRSFVNLPHLHGDESWELPLASTFVISQKGKIAFADFRCDYRERPEPAAVLASLATGY